ncbi:MAG TPA: lysine-sensitive aspartokinase 3 [Balneolales bacterium]|nr:lysine-sensitive aspartokinase 3 [Balneolales bacterium]
MNLKLTVSKFGGTSLAEYDAMLRSAKIVVHDPSMRVVVASATSGTTNALVALSKNEIDLAQKGSILNELRDKHFAILSNLSDMEYLKSRLQQLLDNLKRVVTNNDHKITQELRDTILSHGELMSTLILTQILRELGVDAVWQDAREVMKTDSAWGAAEPDIALIESEVHSRWVPLVEKQVVVTQGFIGSDANGKTTTLGRGGSDYSAALFAEAIHADSLKIWTDVPAIYTTDPRMVPDAQPIAEISFAEAAELATFGGKILHPATLMPAVRKNIPVYIGSSFEPDRTGTWVVAKSSTDPLVRALTVRRKQTLLTVQSMNMFQRHGFLARLFSVLARYKISVDLVTTSEVSVSLTLDNIEYTTGKATIPPEMLEELREFCSIQIEENLSLVAIIGNRMQHSKGLSGALFSGLSDYNIRLVCHGASSHNLCFLVSEDDATEVARRIHKIFLSKKEQPMTETQNGVHHS